MKKISFSVIICIVIVFGISVLNKRDSSQYNVGLVYLMSHPAIDQGITGYKEQLAKEFPEGNKNVKTIYSNANGEIKNINAIIQSYIDKDVDAVIALTTPAAQVANRLLSDKPLIFVGVTDPISAGLVDSLKNGKENVTGTTSRAPVFETLQLALKVFPNVKSIGIIYSSFEANSASILQTLKEKIESKKLPVTIKEKAINSTKDIHNAATSLSRSVDAFFLINDNTVITAVEMILRIADESKIPVFASDIDSVKKGALLTLGLDYKDEGIESAKILKSILVNHNPPNEIPIFINQKYYLNVNKKLYTDFPNAKRELLADAKVIE